VHRGFFEEQGILKAEQGDSLEDYGVLKADQDNSRPYPRGANLLAFSFAFGVLKRADSCL
jgi:hypothetical protein